MEYDYVSEKVWDSLMAGCIPIYLGSSTVSSLVPDPSGIIIYDADGKGNVSTPEQLDELLYEIGSNKERYEAMIAWKYKKVNIRISPVHVLPRHRSTQYACCHPT